MGMLAAGLVAVAALTFAYAFVPRARNAVVQRIIVEEHPALGRSRAAAARAALRVAAGTRAAAKTLEPACDQTLDGCRPTAS